MPAIKDLYADQWQALEQADTAEPKADQKHIIKQAIERLSSDAGAVLEKEPLEAFRSLYQTDPASYARYRGQIKEIKGVTIGLFDKLTQVAMNQDKQAENDLINTLFYPVELWEHPVQGEDLLNDIKHTIKHYIIADDATLTASTLWACFTWFIDVVSYAPIANITAPEKRCGKTKLLSVLKRLSYNSLITSNISPAALFRLIEQYKPTLLIDEVDSFLNAHEDMRGIINAGFTRESALIVRCVGEDKNPALFNVWGAKALCGIGKIADTLQDRSIPLKLRRKTQGETVHNVDKSAPEQWAILRSKLARFAQDNQLKLINITVELLPQLNDRANDCFEPLLQIATLAGEHWLESAKNAAIQLCSEQEDNNSTRTELLQHIQMIFDTKRIDRVFSHELATYLNEDNEANWFLWNKGRGMTPNSLAKQLREFDIFSKSIRIGLNTAKGYLKEQFNDAFTRYLTSPSPDTTITNVTTSQAKEYREDSQNSKRHNVEMLRFENTLQDKPPSACDVVTFQNTVSVERVREHTTQTLQNTHHNQNNLSIETDEDQGVTFDLN